MELDFSMLIEDPPFPFDYILSNGSKDIEIHTLVLHKISPVFRNILSGDKSAKRLTTSDISDRALTWFVEQLYKKPVENSKVYSVMSVSHNDLLGLIRFSVEYDICFLQTLIHSSLINDKERLVFPANGKYFEELLMVTKDTKIHQQVLEFAAGIIEKCSAAELATFPPFVLKSTINTFTVTPEMFIRFEEYALDSNADDDEVVQVVEEFLPKLVYPEDAKSRAIAAHKLYLYASEIKSEKIGKAIMNQLDQWHSPAWVSSPDLNSPELINTPPPKNKQKKSMNGSDELKSEAKPPPLVSNPLQDGASSRSNEYQYFCKLACFGVSPEDL